jgi:hypothetical protein
VSQVADYIEKRARESENIAKVIELQNRLHPKLQVSGRFRTTLFSPTSV